MKNIIIIGVSIAVLELVIGIIYLQRHTSSVPTTVKQTAESNSTTASPTSNAKGKFSLSAEKSQVKVGDEILVNASIDTGGGKSPASDLILKFDPQYLKLKNESAPFTKGKAFEQMVFNQGVSKDGLASMSSIADINKLFSGDEVFGSLSFIALKPGQTKVTVVFQLNDTKDSNIVVAGKDILSTTSDLNLEVLP